MSRYFGRPTVRMSEPLVRTSLPNLFKRERVENGNHLSRLQDGNRRHQVLDHDYLGTDELTGDRGYPVI